MCCFSLCTIHFCSFLKQGILVLLEMHSGHFSFTLVFHGFNSQCKTDKVDPVVIRKYQYIQSKFGLFAVAIILRCQHEHHCHLQQSL